MLLFADNLLVSFRTDKYFWGEVPSISPSLYRCEFCLLQFIHRAWTDARRCDSLRTVFGSFSYCPFTVHLVPKIGYIRWN